MKLAEFKAWFEGFTEDMDGAPTEAQFKRIKDRVAEIDGSPITERVFVDRYLPTGYRPRYSWQTPLVGAVGGAAAGANLNNVGASSAPFASTAAMSAVGTADHNATVAA